MNKKIYIQKFSYSSPWSIEERIKFFLWEYIWVLFCSWTPKPFNMWRLLIMRLFGAKLYGKPFVHQRARIQKPWNLIMHNHATIGDRANIYSLAKVEIMEFATVAQEAYVCGGTHRFETETMNLITSPIVIGKHAFIGARAFVLPGITIGEYAIVGACSLIAKDVEPWTVVGGNPAKFIKKRVLQND